MKFVYVAVVFRLVLDPFFIVFICLYEWLSIRPSIIL